MKNPSNPRFQLPFEGNESAYQEEVERTQKVFEAARAKAQTLRERVDALTLESVALADDLDSALKAFDVDRVTALQTRHTASLAILRMATPQLAELSRLESAAELAFDGATAELRTGWEDQENPYYHAKRGTQAKASAYPGTPTFRYQEA